MAGGRQRTTAELRQRCHFLRSVEDLCEPPPDGGFSQALAGPCGSWSPSLSPNSALLEQPGLGPAGHSTEANQGSKAELSRSPEGRRGLGSSGSRGHLGCQDPLLMPRPPPPPLARPSLLSLLAPARWSYLLLALWTWLASVSRPPPGRRPEEGAG